jgi:transposase InsO family protein
MLKTILLLLRLLATAVMDRRALVLENLALRRQVALYKRTSPRPRCQPIDRLFWVWLSRTWSGWRETLLIVKPDTVVRWHRQGFGWYWHRLARRKTAGRPPLSPEIQTLIRQMAAANPLWGALRIHGELLKLGLTLSERTVSRLLPKRNRPPSQTWRAFLQNHLGDVISLDFFTVPTATFRILFVLVVLAHDRRRVLHVNVTAHPTARWTAHQLVRACSEKTAAPFLLRDRDSIYGKEFRGCVRGLGLEEVLTAPHSPWQNPFVERLLGSIRRECLDHVVVLSERHLRRMLCSYVEYYHRSRTHLALVKDTPEPRAVQPSDAGAVVQLPQVGGLHHRYERRAA